MKLQPVKDAHTTRGSGASPAEDESKRKRQYEPGDPYADGYEASMDGVGKKDNPYERGHRYHELWLAGWRVPRENSKKYLGDD